MAIAVNNNPHQRIFYFDVIRVLALLLVATIHCMGASQSPLVTLILNLFQSSAVPLFVMVSGALLLNKNIPFEIFFQKRFVNVVIPFVFWSVIVFFIKFGQGEKHSLLRLFPDFIEGNIHPIYWFVYMLLGLYLLAPIFSKFVVFGTHSDHRYAFWLFGGAILLSNFPAVNLKLPFVLPYVAYFFAGSYLSSNPFGFIRPSLWLVAVLTLASIQFYLTGVAHISMDNTSYIYLMTLALFCTIQRHESGFKLKWVYGPIVCISRYSYGVYLIHFIFISLLEKFGMYHLRLYSFPLIILLASTSIGLSMLFLAIFNRLPYASKVSGLR